MYSPYFQEEDVVGPASCVAVKAKQQALRGGQSVDEVEVGEVGEVKFANTFEESSWKMHESEDKTHPASVKSGTGVKIGCDAMSICTALEEFQQFR